MHVPRDAINMYGSQSHMNHPHLMHIVVTCIIFHNPSYFIGAEAVRTPRIPTELPSNLRRVRIEPGRPRSTDALLLPGGRIVYWRALTQLTRADA